MLTPYPADKLDQQKPDEKLLSVVVPTFNEAANIGPLLKRLIPVLEKSSTKYEIIFVDDGSRDNTAQVVADFAQQNDNVRLVRFSRNFGKEAALYAGLAHTKGAAVIQLDADLQHPPEIIYDFIREWHDGGEIVYGARKSREGEALWRRSLTKAFYSLFSRISEVQLMEGLGDFILLDRKVVDAILSLPERERFTKGLYAWVGFKRVAIPFTVAPRIHGQSGWDIFKLVRFALNAITSFGSVPLKVWSYVGFFLSVSAVAYASIIFLDRAINGSNIRGYPAMMAAVCFFSGVQLMGLGIVGEYLSRIMSEVKQRPLYLVQERIGFEEEVIAETEDKKVERIAS